MDYGTLATPNDFSDLTPNGSYWQIQLACAILSPHQSQARQGFTIDAVSATLGGFLLGLLPFRPNVSAIKQTRFGYLVRRRF